MSLIVVDGIRIPITSVIPGALEQALPQPQIRITRSPQHKDAWCYAACAEMVIRYCTKQFIDQCRVASFVKDTDCCPPENPICTRTGCKKDQIGEIFKAFDVLFQDLPHLLLLAPVSHEVTAKPGRLIEVVIDWRTTPQGQQSSHAILIAGVKGDWIFVIDPLPGGPYQGWKMHTQVSRGFGHGRWVRTWSGLTKKV